MGKFVSPREACKILGIHDRTLRGWAKDGKIPFARTPNGYRRYDVEAYLNQEKSPKLVCYCRVSSPKQKEDLARQVDFMKGEYPDAEIIKDIGSGINYKRKGLLAILERAMSGEQLKIVVAHKDRLARFGFDLINWLLDKNGSELVVLQRTELSPEREFVEDLLAVVHVFSCRLYGLRKYKNKIKEDTGLSDAEPSEDPDIMV